MTCCSPDRASVNSNKGPSALLIDSKTSTSCHVGIRCLCFLSSDSTCCMALCCSKILSIVRCLEPHLVGHSVMSACWGRFIWSCTFARAFFFSSCWKKLPQLFCRLLRLCQCGDLACSALRGKNKNT